MGALCMSRLRRESNDTNGGALTYDGLERCILSMGKNSGFTIVDQARDWTGWLDPCMRRMENVKDPRQKKFFLGLGGVPVATCRCDSEVGQQDNDAVWCAPQTVFVRNTVSAAGAPIPAKFWHESLEIAMQKSGPTNKASADYAACARGDDDCVFGLRCFRFEASR